MEPRFMMNNALLVVSSMFRDLWLIKYERKPLFPSKARVAAFSQSVHSFIMAMKRDSHTWPQPQPSNIARDCIPECLRNGTIVFFHIEQSRVCQVQNLFRKILQVSWARKTKNLEILTALNGGRNRVVPEHPITNFFKPTRSPMAYGSFTNSSIREG